MPEGACGKDLEKVAASIEEALQVDGESTVFVGIGTLALHLRDLAKAYKEAQILGDPKLLVNGEGDNFSWIPDLSDLDIRDDASFVYICENETVYGNRIYTLPNTKGHVLVSDQSSMFLSEPVDVSKYGLIHAGVQKNCGPAGVQIVIVREDLIPDDLPGVPTMLRFKTHADSGSLYNTPPSYGIYICGLVFKLSLIHI